MENDYTGIETENLNDDDEASLDDDEDQGSTFTDFFLLKICLSIRWNCYLCQQVQILLSSNQLPIIRFHGLFVEAVMIFYLLHVRVNEAEYCKNR